ncbi:MAG TPA: metal-dependent phosphohydrolase [Thermoanaerobaculia bacterium]|nr:metal-dependent phosphohydrolase [Thermoanaerobaculia bacterium]
MSPQERFLGFARSRGAPDEVAERWWREVEARYREKHRHYHTLAHIEQVLDVLPHADETVVAAAWFHDVIYDGNDNEERSALLAREALAELRFPADEIERVAAMILATKKHDASGLSATEQAFLDADLSILGTDPARYQAYVVGVRKEYAHVPDLLFRPARNRILRAFLERPRIYFTDPFFDAYEQRARANVEAEISGSFPIP